MKKLLLSAALLCSAIGSAFCQNENVGPIRNKTDEVFNIHPWQVNIRDFVHLQDNGRMIIELKNVNDYDKFRNIRQTLTALMKDAAFYKDSLDNNPGNVRINYVTYEDKDITNIQFKRYAPEGDIYVQKKGELSRLKLEQDTISVVMYARGEELSYDDWSTGKKERVAVKSQYPIGITFYLNRYTDLEKVIAETDFNHIFDTLKSTKTEGTINDPDKFVSSTIYNPYSDRWHFARHKGIIKSEVKSVPWDVTNYNDKFMIELNMGVGLVRNTLAPMAEMGLSIYSFRRSVNTRDFQESEIKTAVSLSITPYFFFDRSEAGEHLVKDNWFINLSMGGATSFNGLKTPLLTGGIGYLLIPRGDVFTGATFKAFLNLKIKNSISICPEIISTNNFKQIFPGITLKIF
jgi:hypothetical protein